MLGDEWTSAVDMGCDMCRVRVKKCVSLEKRKKFMHLIQLGFEGGRVDLVDRPDQHIFLVMVHAILCVSTLSAHA